MGLGYVRCGVDEGAGDVLGSSYEIEVAGETVAAEVNLNPMDDPAGERVRG